MQKLLIRTLIVVILIININCHSKSTLLDRNDTMAVLIGNDSISINEIDNKVKQELYDELNRIYIIRKIAIEEILKDKLLSFEASKYGMDVTSILDSIYQRGLQGNRLDKYIEENHYNAGIPTLERSLLNYDIHTSKGNELLIKRYKDYLLKHYIDSLKTVYKISILLKPPVSPNIKTQDLLIHSKGKIDSKVTFLVVSDFECDMCREYNHLFDSLYFKYRDRIRFSFINFGSYVTISAKASECAAIQGKFWEMHDSIFSMASLPDTNRIFKFADNIGLDLLRFKRDFYDPNIQNLIENNMHLIMDAGIYATPTILINQNLIFNSASQDDIEKTILIELEKANTK
jgi:hypothetical protein